VSFSDPDSTIRGQAVEYFLDSISFASELNSPLLLVGLLQGRLSPTLPYADARKNIIECLTQCAAQAARSHITIGLEPVNRFLLGYHAKADEIIELIKEINLLNVRLLLDTYHMNMEESCMEETLISYAPWLVHVHLSDNNRRIPGRGSIDFARIIKVLKAINYQGYVSIEADDDDWFAAISASSRLLLPLFSSDKVNGK
jgi:sugar phosphate isomerase/epimerase